MSEAKEAACSPSAAGDLAEVVEAKPAELAEDQAGLAKDQAELAEDQPVEAAETKLAEPAKIQPIEYASDKAQEANVSKTAQADDGELVGLSDFKPVEASAAKPGFAPENTTEPSVEPESTEDKSNPAGEPSKAEAVAELESNKLGAIPEPKSSKLEAIPESNTLGATTKASGLETVPETEAASGGREEAEPLLGGGGEPAPELPPRPRTETRSPARAQSQARGADDGRAVYRLKDIQWQEPATGRVREVKIVTQNENGPCPLIALVNVLQLAGVLQIVGSRRTITDAELTGMLADQLFQQDAGSPAVAEKDVSAALSLLPTLSEGLDVDLQFAHIYDFGDSGHVQLFRAFGVDLVHGWVVDADGEADVAAVLAAECRNSYEGAVEYILACDEASQGAVVGGHAGELDARQQRAVASARLLSAWLERTATQLTDSGLRMLGAMLPDNRLCVLFRNNHFSTLYRRGPGELFVLCTDDAVAGDARIVWESLRDVHQATSQFFDSQFALLSSKSDDYVQAGAQRRDASVDEQEAAQIDEDYALALRLHEQEEQERQRRGQQPSGGSALQVRQQDRMPPGMQVREHGQLYGVPEVSREGETRLARAMYRTASDENFERQMESTFLPNTAAKNTAYRQQQQRPKKPDEDKCIIC